MYAFSFVYWAVVGMGVEGEVGVAAVSTLEVEGAYSTEGAIAVERSTRFLVHSSAAHSDCAVAANGFFGVVSAGSVVVVGAYVRSSHRLAVIGESTRGGESVGADATFDWSGGGRVGVDFVSVFGFNFISGFGLWGVSDLIFVILIDNGGGWSFG